MLILILSLSFCAILLAVFLGMLYTRRKPHQSDSKQIEKPDSRGQTGIMRLSDDERLDMLDNIRNIAADDPRRTAGLIRSWLNREKE